MICANPECRTVFCVDNKNLEPDDPPILYCSAKCKQKTDPVAWGQWRQDRPFYCPRPDKMRFGRKKEAEVARKRINTWTGIPHFTYPCGDHWHHTTHPQ